MTDIPRSISVYQLLPGEMLWFTGAIKMGIGLYFPCLLVKPHITVLNDIPGRQSQRILHRPEFLYWANSR